MTPRTRLPLPFCGRSPALRALLFAATLGMPVPLGAQSAADILTRMNALQTERIAGIHDMTLTVSIGSPTPESSGEAAPPVVIYMEKQERDGREVLIPVDTRMNGQESSSPVSGNLFRYAGTVGAQWADRATVTGAAEVDGHAVTILEVTDFEGLPMVRARVAGRKPVQERIVGMRSFVDDADLVIRRVETDMEVTREDGSTAPVHTTISYQDYRSVGGYPYPWTTRIVTVGAAYLTHMDVEMLKDRVVSLRDALAHMPEDRRARTEATLQRMESWLGPDGGTTETVMEVTDVKVNTGPPGP